MTADAISPSTPSLDAQSVSDPSNLPTLPAALLPYAGLLFQRFPEVLLALGNPSLGREFELPPAKGSFAIVEETGARKLVQVVLSRCASRGDPGHEIIPGVCQKPHRLRDIFRGERDTAERPHHPLPKVRWNNAQSEWEAIRLNPGVYDIVGTDAMDRDNAPIDQKREHSDSRQSRPSKSKANKHSRTPAAATTTAITQGETGRRTAEAPTLKGQPFAVHQVAKQLAAVQSATVQPPTAEPLEVQQLAQPASAEAATARAAELAAAEHQNCSANGQGLSPNKAPLISWAGHSCAQGQQIWTQTNSPLKAVQAHPLQPPREATASSLMHGQPSKNPPMPLQEPESPRSPGNFNPWADEVAGFGFGPRERRRSDPLPATQPDEAPCGFGLSTVLRRGPVPGASPPEEEQR